MAVPIRGDATPEKKRVAAAVKDAVERFLSLDQQCCMMNPAGCQHMGMSPHNR